MARTVLRPFVNPYNDKKIGDIIGDALTNGAFGAAFGVADQLIDNHLLKKKKTRAKSLKENFDKDPALTKTRRQATGKYNKKKVADNAKHRLKVAWKEMLDNQEIIE